MSSSGFPDWQRITQWFAAPVDQGAGVSLDGGDVVSGPFDLLSFASVVVCVKATGGQVTVTVKQTIPGAPASLQTSSAFVVAAGNVVFEPIVLDAGIITVTFHEAAPGTSVDYALVPSNVNSNVAGSLLAQLGFQHNDTPVANETAIDLEDSSSVVWTLADDAANGRVKVTAAAHALAGATVLNVGTTTYTPPAGATQHVLELWGAGAGGTACAASGATTNCAVGSGGGAGGYLWQPDAFTGTVTVAVGVHGTGGVVGGFNAGTAGGNTTYVSPNFGSLGGLGGSGAANGIGGGTTPSYAGGGACGGTSSANAHLALLGAVPSAQRLSGAVGASRGGVAPMAGGGSEVLVISASSGQPGAVGGFPGGGGSGAVDTANTSRVGGNGADGVIRINSYY